MSSANQNSVSAQGTSLLLLVALKFAGAFGWILSAAIHTCVLLSIVACVRRQPPPPEKPTLIDVTLVELPTTPDPGPPGPPVQKPPEAPVPVEVKQPDPPKPVVEKQPDPPKPVVVKQPDPPKPVVEKKPDPPKPVVVKKPDPPKPPRPSLQERMKAAQAAQKDKMVEREKQAQAERRRREQTEAQRREAERRRLEATMRDLASATSRTHSNRRSLSFAGGGGKNLPAGVPASQAGPYARYMGLVETRLAPLWEQLGPTGLSGNPGDVTVQFTVRADGTVVARLVLARSDNAQMNEAAQRLLNAVRRLPAFAEANLSGTSSTLNIEFTLGYSRENRR